MREDIPLLGGEDAPVYFDNACMTLKPRPVIEALTAYYEKMPVCAGRSTHALARRVGEHVEASRAAVSGFLGADRPSEVVFTKNTTEALNLAARGLGLEAGSTVLTTDREHNSNLVPFQRLEKVHHEAVRGTREGEVDLEAWKQRLERGDVSLVSVCHMSNLDGYKVPVGAIAEIAHDHGALVLVDGAQSAPHMPVDVHALGVDLFAFSVHKMMGPTGVGVLWGREDVLEGMEPLVSGGSTIETTRLDGHTLRDPPGRFEAGLQGFGGLVATRAAVEYVDGLGLKEVQEHEERLSLRLQEGLEERGVTVIGASRAKGNGIVSFTLEDVGIHELAILLEDKGGVLVRSGLHCLDSWFYEQGLEGSCRASLYAYNTLREVEHMLGVIDEIQAALGG